MKISRFLISYSIALVSLLGWAIPSYAGQECRPTYVQPGWYCSTALGAASWHADTSGVCGSLPANYLCCCQDSSTQSVATPKPISTKAILISSVVGFFAIMTVLAFVYKSHE